jgi:hypothetical protein
MSLLMPRRPLTKCVGRNNAKTLASKGCVGRVLKDPSKLEPEQRADLDALVAQYTTNRVARAWLYREQLRDILDRKRPNVVETMLRLVYQRHAIES